MADFAARFTNYRGHADELAAVEAFYAAAEVAGLTYADFMAEQPSEAVRRAYRAAVDAAWPNRVTTDPSYQGWIEVDPR